MSYHANKHFGIKSGQFKTVLGYVPDTKTRYVQALNSNEKIPIEQNHSPLPLMYILLYRHDTAKNWKIIRLCRV